MDNVEYIPQRTRNALIVHPDIAVLSALQAAVAQQGLTPIVARDLPTALLAISHHRFELCVLSQSIAEKSDGWALASVLHMCFHNAFIAMIAPEPDLLMLQTAINTGVTQLYLDTNSPSRTVADILCDFNGSSGSGPVQ